MRPLLMRSVLMTIVLAVACAPAAPARVATAPSAATPIPGGTPVPASPTPSPIPPSATPALGIPLPPPGHLYTGVYPGGRTGAEDDITLKDLQAYTTVVGKPAAWVYFSNNWFHGRAFPLATAAWIRSAGSIPFIRLMLRSDADQDHREPLYNLQNILAGQFDQDLHAWCAAARDFGTPLLAEYGTEMNGSWFSWNGHWNGGATKNGYGDPALADGPERFRDAYRHIIDICRAEHAANITWVFHVNDGDYPAESWNRFENYYPGDDYIDWLAISVYGEQVPNEGDWPIFRDDMDAYYPRLAALAPAKPIIVAEFGVTAGSPDGNAAVWALNALSDLTALRWPRVIGFSWWNEWWQNDDDPNDDTDMRVQSTPPLGQAFRELVGQNPLVLGHIGP